MSCPTCSHTLESCTLTISHCPRCGTMVMDDRPYVPKLVARCREFEAWCKEAHGWKDTNHYKKWHSTGIEETINAPENRP